LGCGSEQDFVFQLQYALIFKKEKYYTGELYCTGFTLSTDRIDSLEIVEDLVNVVGNTIVVKNVEKKEKLTKPDLPFDLTTLQRECNKYFGYSAKQTLDYAQSSSQSFRNRCPASCL